MELTVDQAMQQGVAAHKEGNLQEAERLYRAILQTQPRHPYANHNLGVLVVSLNKSEAALPLFKTALEVHPKIEQFWLSYIDALIKENQVENAKKVLEQGKKSGLSGEKVDALEMQLTPITQEEKSKLPEQKSRLTFAEKRKNISEKKKRKKAKNPSQSQLNSLLEHYQSGRYGDAEKLAISITEQFPEYQFSWKVLGAVLKQTGRVSAALVANQKAVKLDPQDSEAYSNLGVTLKDLGRFEEAEASCRQAIALKPDFSEAHGNLGDALQGLGRLEEAEASYREAIALKSDYAVAHSNLGVTLQKLGRLEEAEASYREAIALKSDYAAAHSNLGVTLQELGRFEEAEANYRQALALKIDYAEAHRYLSQIKNFNKEDEHFVQMKSLYLDQNLADEQRCHISFALGKASEDLNQLGRSFKYYSEGNALRKKLLNYDILQDIERFDQLKKSYPSIEKNSLETFNLLNKPKPIFILGMPRSGTTLVEQIIASHSEVTGAGELPYIGRFGGAIARGITKPDAEILINFRERYLKKLQDVFNGCPLVTDKMPFNFKYIGLIYSAFPDAKIVHVKRNPAAVCWGNYKEYFTNKSIGYCYELDDIIAYYGLYQDLMQFWGERYGDRIYSLNYEALTINQEAETRKLIQYIGLAWEEECLAPQDNTRSIKTASNQQVRQKIYQGSSQKWKKFEPFLKGAFNHFEG